ncbi:MAG: 3-methyl-2-oxobutanoate dehydrogenase subunit VorB, partial [Acidobacteria bacterium]|nr:3-methyl-2-oxobutanoate dehydrogenase subunit VorB [Acidobacteriota bacterium]
PITVWPFPKGRIAELASRDDIRFFISIEMSAGQMVEDIQLNVCGKKPVHFYGRMGGIVPTPQEILDTVQSHLKE